MLDIKEISYYGISFNSPTLFPPTLLSAVAAPTVSLLFWVVLFPAIGRTSLVDVHCHAVNSLIVLADLTLTHVPYYLKVGVMMI